MTQSNSSIAGLTTCSLQSELQLMCTKTGKLRARLGGPDAIRPTLQNPAVINCHVAMLLPTVSLSPDLPKCTSG
jgi:hypothetical protein